MNVQEVLNISKERKLKTKEATKKIVESVHKKILYYANLKKESCTYLIPPVVNDIPLFDIDTVVKDVFKILDSEGYIVSAFSNGRLDVCWNEKLVEQKVKADAYIISEQERKLKNITKKAQKVDERFSFLANPKKVNKEKTVDELLDDQVSKILKEKERTQKKFKNIVGNFNKI